MSCEVKASATTGRRIVAKISQNNTVAKITPSAPIKAEIATTQITAKVSTGRAIKVSATLGQRGIQGEQGEPGEGADLNYVHNQGTPSAIWTITHNLAKYPSCSVVDSSGSEVEGDVNHVSANQLTVSFAAGFSGKAFLN